MPHVIHHVSPAQVEALRRTFTHPKQVLFVWPMAENGWLEESMEGETPAWVDLLAATAQPQKGSTA